MPISDEVFDALVLDHQAWIRGLLRALGVECDSVDDVAQEVFLVAYRRWDEHHRDVPVAAWLRGIARHLAANARRSQAVRARVIHHELALLLAEDEAACPVQAIADQEALAAVRSCIDRLPDRSKELFRLRYAEQLDMAQLGELLGRDANAVRQALFRLRETVRRCIDGRLGREWA